MAADTSPTIPIHVLVIAQNVRVPADRRLWPQLLALKQAGYELSVICEKQRSTDPFQEVIDHVRVFRYAAPYLKSTLLRQSIRFPFALFWEFWLSQRLHRRANYEIVFLCHPSRADLFVATFLKRFRKKKILVDYRQADIGPDETALRMKGRRFERAVLKIGDIVFSVNEVLRKIASRRGDIPAEKIITLRPHVDSIYFGHLQTNLLWRNGRSYLVAYSGEVSEAKGLKLLRETIEYIVYTCGRTDIQFVIAGSGPEWNDVALSYGRADLGDFVTFSGELEDENLLTILATADICVNPRPLTLRNATETNESVMQYMAVGKPIVQFEMPENRQVAQSAARYVRGNDPVEFGKQIMNLLDNREIRSIMGDFAKNHARKEFSWNFEREKLLWTFGSVAEGVAKPSGKKKRKH